MTADQIRQEIEPCIVRDGHFVYTSREHGSIYVHKDIADQFCVALEAEAALRNGNGTVAPLVDERMRTLDRKPPCAIEGSGTTPVR